MGFLDVRIMDIVEYLELNVASAGHKPGEVTKPRVEII